MLGEKKLNHSWCASSAASEMPVCIRTSAQRSSSQSCNAMRQAGQHTVHNCTKLLPLSLLDRARNSRRPPRRRFYFSLTVPDIYPNRDYKDPSSLKLLIYPPHQHAARARACLYSNFLHRPRCKVCSVQHHTFRISSLDCWKFARGREADLGVRSGTVWRFGFLV